MSVMDTTLRESLKSLRLSGMLETLDARLTQAHGGELGHLDFLQVLCQDEITRRETVAFQRRLQRAKFEQQATLEEFDSTGLLEASRSPDPRPGRNGSANWYGPTCSSSTTSLCASSPLPTPTTSTNSSLSGRGDH
jgi:hypothetical protein